MSDPKERARVIRETEARNHAAGLHSRSVETCADCRAGTPVSGSAGMSEPRTVVDDATFMENVRDALGNGYDRACAHCGIGTAGDDMDIHERVCPEYDERASR